jgi:aspartate kinase
LGREAAGEGASAPSPASFRTTTYHGHAKIVEIRPERIEEALARGQIALVTASQGASPAGEITTLAASSTPALAAALGRGSR